MEFVATCPRGFESLLADELRSLGCRRVRPLTGQVAFGDTQRDGLRACLWSRLASRIIVVLDRIDASSSDSLYAGLNELPWEEHVSPHARIAIDAHGTNAALRNSHFVALRSKDGIVDRLASRTGVRPQTDAKRPDLTLSVRLSQDRAAVGIDLSGDPLFRRGYEAGRSRRALIAPLRPDYAAALLAAGGWHAHDERAIAIPFVGAGTLAVEAVGMVFGWPAGITRTRWGFQGWQSFEQGTWDALVEEAQAAREHTDVHMPSILLSDLRASSEGATRHLLRAAGFETEIGFHSPEGLADALDRTTLLACDLSWLSPDDVSLQASALSTVSRIARDLPAQSSATALATGGIIDRAIGCAASTTTEVIVGQDDATLRTYAADAERESAGTVITLADGSSVNVFVPQSEQFAARLNKVRKQRAKWARREDVSCYRIYDADLPDYAVTLDLFEGVGDRGRWLQVFEYAPPHGIDADLARWRLLDVVALAPHILGVRPENTFVRVRTRSRGGSQYSDEARPPRKGRGRAGTPLPPGAHLVDEGGLTFEVNFSSRLDCGIFLDHRDTRAMLREMAKETKGSKRFLNLFAYTGTATCYAADGGARFTTTVDLSRPSLDWARRNMERNGFTGREHEYVQADVVRWISEQRRTKNRWDLIFCDVPTFSNSKRMRTTSFDVQRDHAELLIGASRLLTRDGTCVFSCNLRTFKPDVDALAKAGVEIEDITPQTIPEDFSRNPKIHHCYLVRRTPRA